LHGLLGDARNGRLLRAEAEGDDPAALGLEVAQRLKDQGADALLVPRT
jgi:hypothetical protein